MSDLKEATERIFRVPFLYYLRENGQSSTSDIINELRSLFKPEGHDSLIMANRKDDYFSQKIRNIKSHDCMDEYVEYDKKTGWKIKDSGISFLTSIEEVVTEIKSILSNTTFTYYEKITFIDLAILPFFPRRKVVVTKKASTTKKKSVIKKVLYYDESVIEGNSTTKTIKVYERSKSLRDKAITHFTDEDGHIRCSICGFDFSKDYGSYGAGYIEIHHKKPIYQYEDNDVDTVLSSALDNLAPVCANCHRMLHHKKNATFDEVKKAYDENGGKDKK